MSFGWPAPNANRAVDERFSLENVEALLRSGRFEPVTAYHPSLSYLPQSAWLALVEHCGCVDLGTGEKRVLGETSGWRPDGKRHEPNPSGLRGVPGLTALAYRSCRLLQALLGTLSVALVYRLGRRLASPAAGLSAAAMVAGVPWLIWASGLCNEDAVLVLTVLLAASATLAACERPTTLRFALVGVACGLALAAKLNAGAVALPIAFWVAWRWREGRALVPRLALAGLVAMATFVVLNPHFVGHPEMVARDFSHTLTDYAKKGEQQARTRLSVVASGALSPLDAAYLGSLTGAASLAGVLLLVVGARRNAASELGTAPGRLAVTLGFPATYIGFYVAATRNVSPHNWMPLAPFAALLAAQAAAALWSVRGAAAGRTTAMLGARRLLAAAIVLSPLLLGARFVYRALTPTTLAAAEALLERWTEDRARVGVEAPRDRESVVPEPEVRRLLRAEPGRDGQFSVEELEGLDGWIAARPLDDRLQRALARALEENARVELVSPALFELRGPTLQVVWRPWHRAGVERAALLVPDGARAFRFRAPPLPSANGRLVSLRLGPEWQWRPGDCWLLSATRPRIALHAPPGRFRSRGPRRSQVRSDRFSADDANTLSLHCSPRARAEPRFAAEVEIVTWAPPAARPGTAVER